jgi:hypothetical protein
MDRDAQPTYKYVLGARLAWQLDAGCLWNILGSNVG